MEQNKKDFKRIICIILFILTTAFTFFALLFNLYDAKASMSMEGEYYYAESTGNGFSVMLSYPLALAEIGDWLGIYSLIMLVAIIIEIIVYAIMSAKKVKKIGVAEIIFMLLNIVLTLIYMINGFNAKGAIQNVSPLYKVSTSAFIPFIIVAILSVMYFIVVFFVKNNFDRKKKVVKSEEINVADELVKYKQLLDDGVITQEEYDIKKKELLGL